MTATRGAPDVRLVPDARTARLTLLLGCLASFTAFVDSGIVNLALPQIGRAFQADTDGLAWVVTAYIVPFAVSILAVGKLGDSWGRRTVLSGGALLFAAGCAGAAVAPSYPVLLCMRVIQGLGASALLTISLAVVVAAFDTATRPRALGIYFAASALGGIAGPVLGGLLASRFGWEALFMLQVPLGVAVAVMALRILEPATPSRRSLDVPGLALASIALGAVNIVLLEGDAWGWASPWIWAAAIVTVVAGAGFVWRERNAPDPAVDLAVFHDDRFLGSSLVGAATWFAIVSGSVLYAIYLQDVLDLDPFEAALVFLPWPVASLVVFPHAGAIGSRLGMDRAITGSILASGAVGIVMAWFGPDTPLALVALLAGVSGALIPVAVTGSAVSAVAGFAPAQAGLASGIFNSLRQVGASFGIAVPAAAFELATRGPGAHQAAQGVAAAFLARGLGMIVLAVLAAWVLARARTGLPEPAG